ncbi:hypothetical protein EHQ27_05945 [Leptospira wolffii]|uniref:hypothetical protein n=1 Tax=Leptospira wolffii TaxID=409998 RepID=UPI001083D043|nr:hypothetical protein [Leptospira wolffii]TGK61521.1 hypothetical protein EHQ32_01270 [Leptospira wolffii]TGK70065.1 hypothetical protein EHQ35_16685 [Leptospira wolffii]TGK74996.1 hypothetical protein EHQ27_05945 [Leptospira wolffii]TGL31160.1 hypothetical protein EHQ57_07125 [Leptospira wolffii]
MKNILYIILINLTICTFQCIRLEQKPEASKTDMTYKQAVTCCYELCKRRLDGEQCKKKNHPECDCGEECEAGPPYVMLEFGWTPTEEEWKMLQRYGFKKSSYKPNEARSCLHKN